MEQIRRFHPPALPIKKKDSRSKDYGERYGDKGWEVESLRPTTFQRLVEEELRKHVPSEYLARAGTKERVTNIARPIVRRLQRGIEQEVIRLMETGISPDEIVSRLTAEYNLRLEVTEFER